MVLGCCGVLCQSAVWRALRVAIPHIGNGLAAVAVLVTDILWLRSFYLLANLCGLTLNMYVCSAVLCVAARGVALRCVAFGSSHVIWRWVLLRAAGSFFGRGFGPVCIGRCSLFWRM